MAFTKSRIDHHLASSFFGSVDDLLDKSAAIDYDTLMIACSDHGTAPDNVSFARAGRMMILQHLAASVPSAIDCENGLDIEDIFSLLDNNPIRQIIVCGHLGCGVIPTWVRSSEDDP